MKHYAYFPGCSSEATARSLDMSARSISKPLDMQLIDVEKWTCCGSTPYGSLDELESILVAARNLAIAENTGLDLVTPCSSCCVTLSKANLYLKEHPHLKGMVNKALAVANLEYRGNLRVRHLVDVLYSDITPEFIESRVQRQLNGLRVAPYYGCQLSRPDYGFDNTEFPRSIDRLVECLGAEAISFPLKARCCGGSSILSEEDLALELINKLLDNATENGAQCVVTPCPLCQTNLDAYQGRVNSRFRKHYNLPVLFITQLIGIALGISPESLGLDTNIVPANNLLEYAHKPIAYATTHDLKGEDSSGA